MNTLDELFSAAVGTSWRLGLLLALCLILRRWLRNRVTASALFGIWLILAGALFIHAGIPTAWSPFNLTAKLAPRIELSPAVPVIPVPIAAVPLVPTAPGDSVLPMAAAPLARSNFSSKPAATAIISFRISVVRILAIGWLAGMGFLFALRIAVTLRFSRELNRTKQPVSARVSAAAKQCGALLGVRQPFEVAHSPLVETPSLHGIRRPTLLIPPAISDKLSDEELEMVLLHELGHCQRRDLLAQTLIHTAKVIHWFNPMVWLAERAARTDCEHACDEFVMRHLQADRHGDYGLTLLKVVGMINRPRRLQSVLGIFESKEQLKGRILRISAYTLPNWKRILTGAGLLVLVSVFSLTRESSGQTSAVPLSAVIPAPAASVSTPAAPVAPTKAPATPVAPTAAATERGYWGYYHPAVPEAPAKPAFGSYTNYDTLALANIVNPMLSAGGRNFDAGEKTYRTIGCAVCHIFGDSGGGIGPNLSGIGGRFGAREILDSILEPSANISDLYNNKTVTLLDGTQFTGHRVLDSETEVGFVDRMYVDAGTMTAHWPATPTRVFKRIDIKTVDEAKDSPMPAGLINKLSPPEIADLLAFLMSGGNRNDKIFQPAAFFQPAFSRHDLVVWVTAADEVILEGTQVPLDVFVLALHGYVQDNSAQQQPGKVEIVVEPGTTYHAAIVYVANQVRLSGINQITLAGIDANSPSLNVALLSNADLQEAVPTTGGIRLVPGANVEVLTSGGLKWNGKELSMRELPSQAKQWAATADAAAGVVVTGEDHAPMSATISVLDEIQRAGISKIRLQTASSASYSKPAAMETVPAAP